MVFTRFVAAEFSRLTPGYDVLEMPELPTPGKDDNRPLDLGDFTHGAQSVKAACGCIAFVVLLAIIAFATRELLFR